MSFTRRAALLGALLPLPARARPPEERGNSQGNGRGNGRGQGGGRGGGTPALGGPELSIVQTWLGANPGFVAQPLPPGMRNRLAQGKPLPPGIARRAVPPDLIAVLPARPGYSYAYVGTSLVLIEVATGLVASLLTDALLRR